MDFLKKLASIGKKHLTLTVHLAGGGTIVTKHVKEASVIRSPDGTFTKYEIVWHQGYQPSMFSISIPAIQAFVVEED